MISAIGVSYLLQNLATYVTGGLPQMYPAIPDLSAQLTIAGVSTKYVTVITPVLVVVLVVALTQLINHTKIGMAMRAVFGGIGSIPGAVVGAFLIGICESVIKGSDWSVFSDAFTFALLIVVLCVKPTGLFGEKVTDKV